MLAGFGGERIVHYVGLLADSPALFCQRRGGSRPRRGYLAPGAVTLGVALPDASRWPCTLSAQSSASTPGCTVGIPSRASRICSTSPSIPPSLLPSAFMIRAAAVRVRWVQFALDAHDSVVGFGAFFWFLVIRPASASTEIDVIKNALSQTYIALNCMLLLTLGVLLAGGCWQGRAAAAFRCCSWSDSRRCSWRTSCGRSRKISGDYLPGALQDVLYVACYLPLAAAGREQMRATSVRMPRRGRPTPWRSHCRTPRCSTAFLVLVSFTRGDIGSPATVMTIVVFGLTLAR